MNIEQERQEAETKAWRSLARYKFMQFGYWAAVWVHLNRLSPAQKRNPFTSVVKIAKEKI